MQSEIASETWVGLEPGDLVAGKYRVTRIIGRGGMGIVAEAVHEAEGHRVAIKVLRPSPEGQAEATARFLFEAKAAAQMKSVHVARVLDVSTLEAGAPYFVMEYLEGQDLSVALKREGVLSIETAVDYVLQTCEALAEAHTGGIVHGDLKPSNLFLTVLPGDNVLVKLLDFGISKQVPLGNEADLRTTKTHWPVMGTPLYMAPEQMRTTRRVDHRADIWALGVLLHECLTGQMPFVGASLTEMSAAIAADPPVSCRAQRPGLPEEIEAIVMRCLEKEPDSRFANVGELANALLPFGPANAAMTEKRIATVLARATNVTAPPPPPSGPPPSLPILKTPWMQMLPTVPTLMVQPAPSLDDAGSRPTAVPHPQEEEKRATTAKPGAPSASVAPASTPEPDSLPVTRPTGAATVDPTPQASKAASNPAAPAPSDVAKKPAVSEPSEVVEKPVASEPSEVKKPAASGPSVAAFTAPLPPEPTEDSERPSDRPPRSRAALWIGLAAMVLAGGVGLRVMNAGKAPEDTNAPTSARGSAEAPLPAAPAVVAPAIRRPAATAPVPSSVPEVASVQPLPPPPAPTASSKPSHHHHEAPASGSSPSTAEPAGTSAFGGSRE